MLYVETVILYIVTIVSSVHIDKVSPPEPMLGYVWDMWLQVHLSFSLYGTDDGGQPKRLRQNVMDVFLQSVGIVLTDIQDVVFK